MSETAILQAVRLALSRAGVVIFRNQVGALRDADDRVVRFGLCPGSSDLIGWRSVTITPEMVGQRVAVFTACEVKTPTGRTRPEQTHFLATVRDAGGIAMLVRSAEEAAQVLASQPRA